MPTGKKMKEELEELNLHSYKNLYYLATQQIELLLGILVKRDKEIKKLKEDLCLQERR